tara:strand:+ start:699 stop:1853 length:1155 start_codon:yes stop_codon:yes gene_type:complete
MSSVASEITVFFILILLGFLLKFKFNKPDFKNGLKLYILNIALPATIFISIVSVQINSKYLLFPLIALFFNIMIFLLSPVLLKISNITDARKKRTLFMLLASFAPGLSCFPIINEFLGYESLAKASIIDFGNKLFVLIFLFFVAFKFHNSNQNNTNNNNNKPINTVIKSLFLEPINIIIFMAILFLSSRSTINDIPILLIDLFSKIKDTLTPVVLIFIGLSIVFNRNVFKNILPLLFLRSGLCLLISTACMQITGFNLSEDIKLFLVLSLSSVSFWPFLHMTFVDNLEKNMEEEKKTFDTRYGLNFLAYSLPFSTITILSLFSNEQLLLNFNNVYFISISFLLIGIFLTIIFNPYRFKSKEKKSMDGINYIREFFTNKLETTQK